MFMTTKQQAEEIKRLADERTALIKKGQEIEAKKGERCAWSYFQRAELIMEQIAKISARKCIF